MKNLTITIGLAILLTGCYAMETIEGEPSGCRPECDDGDPCTEDFCDTEDNCHNVPIPGCGVDCTSDADCDDGVDCTLDYCDVAGICQHVDLCVEECDPDIHGINLLEAVGSIEAASNGEQIILVSSGPGAGESGRIDLFDPADPPTDMPPLQRIDEGYSVRKPFVFWGEGEEPRLFWSSTSDGISAVMMTAVFNNGSNELEYREEVWPEAVHPTLFLNDVAKGKDGQYGLAFEFRDPAEPDHIGFANWDSEAGIRHIIELSSANSRGSVICGQENGWSIGFSAKDESLPTTNRIYSGILQPPTGLAMDEVVATFYNLETLAAINNTHHEMVIFQQDHDEGLRVIAGWLDEDGTATRIEIARNISGLSTLGSYSEEHSLVSWCNINLSEETSSVQVSRLGSEAIPTPIFTANLSCSKTELIRVGDDDYLIWISEPGGVLYYKNLSCH